MRNLWKRLWPSAPATNKSTPAAVLKRLRWNGPRVLLDDLVFLLEQQADGQQLDDNCFRLYKDKRLLDQYERFWRDRAAFQADRVFELGIWDGGSAAFWYECFHPEKLVAIDVCEREDSAYSRQFVASRGLAERFKTYWGVDQADSARLRRIVAGEFAGPLDLVIDDASHVYEPTKKSFETLFPLLRPGGLYIIEDWSWVHWKGVIRPDDPLARETELTKLVVELVEAAGTLTDLIASLSVYQVFVAVERGPLSLEKTDGFRLDDYIARLERP